MRKSSAEIKDGYQPAACIEGASGAPTLAPSRARCGREWRVVRSDRAAASEFVSEIGVRRRRAGLCLVIPHQRHRAADQAPQPVGKSRQMKAGENIRVVRKRPTVPAPIPSMCGMCSPPDRRKPTKSGKFAKLRCATVPAPKGNRSGDPHPPWGGLRKAGLPE
jgi:hypothetical protein